MDLSIHSPRSISSMRFISLLMLVALFASLGAPISTARAAPTNTVVVRVNDSLFVTPSGTVKLCVGEKKDFYVTVFRETSKVVGNFHFTTREQIATELVNTHVLNSAIGTFLPTSVTTSSSASSSQAKLTFTAKKPGQTQVNFNVERLTPLIPDPTFIDGPSTSVQVKVRNCKYKVSSTSSWHFTDGWRPTMVSVLNEVEVTPAESDGTFSASGTVTNVVRASPIEGCVPSMSASPGTADLTGRLQPDGTLKIYIAYETIAAKTVVTCPGAGSQSRTDTASLAPLTLNLGAEGGVSMQAQVLNAYQAITGTDTIVVMPVAEGNAFLPGNGTTALFIGWRYWLSLPFLLGMAGILGNPGLPKKKPSKTRLSGKFRVSLLVVMLLLALVACQLTGQGPVASNGNPPTATGEVTNPSGTSTGGGSIQVNMELGPGDFNLADLRQGLDGLASYKESLTVSFDGSQNGQTSQWTSLRELVHVEEPSTSLLTITNSGNTEAANPSFVAETEGAAYERGADGLCLANAIDPENSNISRLEPVGMLSGLLGAEAAGQETINGINADHYTFDERALALAGKVKSSGEVWVASDGGAILRYKLVTQGDESYFGKGMQGTLTMTYELSDINQPVTIDLPRDCPAGMVTAPMPPDAANVLAVPGVLSFDTATSLADVLAFYQTKLPTLGWVSTGDPGQTDTTAFLEFSQGDRFMNVVISSESGAVKVTIFVTRPAE